MDSEAGNSTLSGVRRLVSPQVARGAERYLLPPENSYSSPSALRVSLSIF
jgi:hypothetical protein